VGVSGVQGGEQVTLPLECYRAWVAARVKAGQESAVVETIKLYRTTPEGSVAGRAAFEQALADQAFADWLEAELERQTDPQGAACSEIALLEQQNQTLREIRRHLRHS
jgi:hypothetical protein